MTEPGSFQRYFHERADLAERLYSEGLRTDALLIATVALDSLAAIWEHDFVLRFGNGSDLRLAAYVQKFSGDERAEKIAVVFLAEDVLQHGPPRLHEVARRLLDRRDVDESPVRPMEFRGTPRAYLDVDWAGLITEEPALAAESNLEKLVARYTYPALLYRLHRCAVAHTMSTGSRTSDFSSGNPDDEISYFPRWVSTGRVHPISLKIGLRAITNWVRASVTSYVAECDRLGKRPADDFEPNAKSLAKLQRKWKDMK